MARLEVIKHLRNLTDPFGPWTFDKDHELLRLLVESGWPAHEVAMELGVSSTQLTQRMHKLGDGKRFAPKDLWPAIQAMAQERAMTPGVRHDFP